MDFGGRERAAALFSRPAETDRRLLLLGRCGLYLMLGAVMASAMVTAKGLTEWMSSLASCR